MSWAIAFGRYIRLEDLLKDSLGSIGVEVAQLDGGGLLKERILLQSRRYELRSLIQKLGVKVTADRTALVHDETIVVLWVLEDAGENHVAVRTYEVRDLTKRLFLEVRRCFVFALSEVHRHELEWNLLLAQDRRDASSAGREGVSEEPEDHLSIGGSTKGWVGWYMINA